MRRFCSRGLCIIASFAIGALGIFCGGGNKAEAQEGQRAAWQVTRFDIAADLSSAADANRALNGHAQLSARNVGQGSGRTFTVRINASAVISAARVGGGVARFNTRAEPSTKLQQAAISLPDSIQPGGEINVAIDYSLPITENSGLMSLSPDGAEFLPLSFWYPAPNTQFAPRGEDSAPVHLVVNGVPQGESLISSGTGEGSTYDQKLNAQPFFVTGKWETVEGIGAAHGISALSNMGAGADERRGTEAIVALAAAARSYFADLFGSSADVPIRFVAVDRGAGFDDAGTLLLDEAVFRRPKMDSLTAMLISEAVARVWVGGTNAVRGEGSGVVREGLCRFLATLFIEKQFGSDAAASERLRQRIAFGAVARQDAPLSLTTPLDGAYYASVADKGAMVWRLIDRFVGRDVFISVLRSRLKGADLSLSGLRSAYIERGGEGLQNLLAYELDKPTDMNLMIGLPQNRGGSWSVALRNQGSFQADVTVQARTDSGAQLKTDVVIPARDFGEAQFKTPARLVLAEIDPGKFYPQMDYSDDIAPRGPAPEEALADIRRLITQGEFSKAESLARDTLARTPQMEEVRMLLARALLEQNRAEEAEKEFRAGYDAPLPLPSTLAWADIGLAEIALKRNQPAEAAKRFNEAVAIDAEYASSLAARSGRIKAEAAAGAAPAPDQSVRDFLVRLDAAIRSGHKADLDALLLPGELGAFRKGIIGTQPEAWQTRLLRTEQLSSDTVAADVYITARTLGHDETGTAVIVLSRDSSGWRVSGIRLFEVR